jgi:gamma-glutamyl:cysteine ligase YbdK (ATP-grasp superfamily)
MEMIASHWRKMRNPLVQECDEATLALPTCKTHPAASWRRAFRSHPHAEFLAQRAVKKIGGKKNERKGFLFL